jgi:arylsulfatase A-like enzyme
MPNRVPRREFLKLAGAGATAVAFRDALWAAETAATVPSPGLRPNLIFILADDLGLPGVGCCGGPYATPHLDALAASGIRFEHCFAAPLCAPSRGLCMTGRYPFRTGVVDNSTGAAAHPDRETCIARTLKAVGYATAVAGKWRQLGYFQSREDAAKWGFDEFLIWGVGSDPERTVEQGRGSRYWDPDFNRNGESMKDTKGRYGPDLLQEFVLDFVRRHREGPFFVYYPMPLVHGPILRTPDSPAQGANHYADNIAYMDRLVGALVAELGRLGLREKTLVVFTGDNGSIGGTMTLGGRPVLGRKGTLLEGGSRVPCIASWPGTAPAATVLPDLVDFTDFYVTFAELAGAKLPEGVVLDGRSFAPRLRGQPGRPREWVFVQLGAEWYVRERRWKLTGKDELFDLSDAPFAEKPVPKAGADPEAEAARERLRAVLAQLDPAAGKTSARRPRQAAGARRAARRARQGGENRAP